MTNDVTPAPQYSMIDVFAGTRPDGQPIIEQLKVKPLEGGSFELIRSPAFVKGLAAGDVVKKDDASRDCELITRAGNLAIRIFAREDIRALANDITPLIEKLGGQLDHDTPRMLVFSIHVSCGFSAIEKILNDHIDEDMGSAWFYGNVYDPQDGVTPLGWWKRILEEQ